MILDKLKENLITNFLDYLKENNLEISINWIVNECYINNFLDEYCYNLNNNKTAQDEFYEILDDYCCSNAIPLF